MIYLSDYEAQSLRLSKMTTTELAAKLTEAKIAGRSSAKTKAQKIALLLAKHYKLSAPVEIEPAVVTIDTESEQAPTSAPTEPAALTFEPLGDEPEDQVIYHRQFLTPARVDVNLKKWLDHKDKGSIVAVAVPFKNGNPGYQYRAYGSHARAIARLYGHATYTREDGITAAAFSHSFSWHVVAALRSHGIELTLVD